MNSSYKRKPDSDSELIDNSINPFKMQRLQMVEPEIVNPYFRNIYTNNNESRSLPIILVYDSQPSNESSQVIQLTNNNLGSNDNINNISDNKLKVKQNVQEIKEISQIKYKHYVLKNEHEKSIRYIIVGFSNFWRKENPFNSMNTWTFKAKNATDAMWKVIIKDKTSRIQSILTNLIDNLQKSNISNETKFLVNSIKEEYEQNAKYIRFAYNYDNFIEKNVYIILKIFMELADNNEYFHISF